MDIHLWENRHLDKNFICPHCKKGILQLKSQNNIQTVESKKNDISVQKDNMGACAPIQYYYFSAILECNKCEETVLASGECSTSNYYEQDEGFPNDFELMNPKLFLPTLEIIEIPSKTPKEIQEEIYRSFELYWVNESACANI